MDDTESPACQGDSIGQFQIQESPKSGISKLLSTLAPLIFVTPVSGSTLFSIRTRNADNGAVIGWCLALVPNVSFIISRVLVLSENNKRRTTEGLNLMLFLAEFLGNVFYCAGLLTNPFAWNDFPPYGGNGWADEHGSDRKEWLILAAPFFFGAAAVASLWLAYSFYIFQELYERSLGIYSMIGGGRKYNSPSASENQFIYRIHSYQNTIPKAEIVLLYRADPQKPSSPAPHLLELRGTSLCDDRCQSRSKGRGHCALR